MCAHPASRGILLGRFSRYLSIGVLNTGLHWALFLALHYGLEWRQAAANVAAFAVAVVFSFVMNARFTFNSEASGARFVAFSLFMGLMTLGTGHLADIWQVMPLLTLVATSGLSLVAGFLYSNYVVFSPRKR